MSDCGVIWGEDWGQERGRKGEVGYLKWENNKEKQSSVEKHLVSKICQKY